MFNVLIEPFVIREYVIDQRSKEDDVASGSQGYPDVGHGRGSRETWVDMNDFGATFAGFHDPLESDRMVFRHVRAHDQDGIGSWKISLCSGSAATAKRCAQTGHSGAVSYSGLVADAVHPQACRE